MLTVNKAIEIGMMKCLEALGMPENGINQVVFRSSADKGEDKLICCLGRYPEDGEYESGGAISDCYEHVVCWINRKTGSVNIWGPFRQS